MASAGSHTINMNPLAYSPAVGRLEVDSNGGIGTLRTKAHKDSTARAFFAARLIHANNTAHHLSLIIG
jgi:hypothetical protein